MKSLTKQKLSDMAADEIINFIRVNALKPGDKLPTEKEISEKLSISRASVREGLMKLESLGLLRKQQGYGIFINEVTIASYFGFMQHTPLTEFIILEKQDILNLLELRFSLETNACLNAAGIMSDEDLAALQNIYNEMDAQIDNSVKFIELDRNFHGWLIKFSGNTIISFFYTILDDLLSKQFQITFKKENLDRIHFDHRNILSAMLQKDEKAIMVSLDTHFSHVREIIEKQ